MRHYHQTLSWLFLLGTTTTSEAAAAARRGGDELLGQSRRRLLQGWGRRHWRLPSSRTLATSFHSSSAQRDNFLGSKATTIRRRRDGNKNKSLLFMSSAASPKGGRGGGDDGAADMTCSSNSNGAAADDDEDKIMVVQNASYTSMTEQTQPSPPPKMSMANGALRFTLEMTALVSVGHTGWTLGAGTSTWSKAVLATAFPAAFCTVWGVFNVPNDPSRSGAAPVPVSGPVRLGLELALLGCGGYSLGSWWNPVAGGVYAGLTLLHYVTYRERIYWLWKQK